MILAFDLGTTIFKGALLSDTGEFRGLANRNIAGARGAGIGRYEADTREWKSAFRGIATELLSGTDLPIRAVAISGNGPTLVPVDRSGAFMDPVMTWMDRRGGLEAEEIDRVQEFHIDPSFLLPKALWLRNHRPEIYEKTRHFLNCPEAMGFWLTGEAATIVPGPYLQRYFWDTELLGKLGMDHHKFPMFAEPGTVLGSVSPRGAEESGLPAGLPLVMSGPDFIVTLLGTASVYPGRACDRSGTSEGINLCSRQYNPDSRLMCYEHVVEPWFNISGIISTSGKALEWFKTAVDHRNMDYTDFLREAGDVASGSGGLLFLPYLTGERAPLWDRNARGAFIGLGLNHGSAEMGRAVLESVGYAIRDVAEVMAENGGVTEELRITGGPSKSRLWNQIKADITGKRILVPESCESELLGNLILALRALGDTDDMAAAADNIVRIREVFEPRRDLRGRYDDMFGLYRRAYAGLKPIYESLAELQES